MSRLSLFMMMELHFLRDFLKHVESDVAKEWTEIEERAEDGQFEDFGDYESAMDYPLFRAEFGSRAVYYELNALLESQLQALAEPVWRRMNPEAGPTKRKTVHDLPFSRVRKLVEDEYRISLTDVDGWNQVERLREIVNSYKHRKGMKRFKDISKTPSTGACDFKYDSSLTEAEEFLKMVSQFLESLFAAVRGKPADA